MLKKQGKQSQIEKTIKRIKNKYKKTLEMPKELCYLEEKEKENYLHDMKICMDFAKQNRWEIADIIMEKMCLRPVYEFQTIHNYIDESGMIRKGAVSAQKDETILIPMNMRDGCIIAIGKGNEDWNCSAPHGAGRIMSRTEAKKKLSIDSYKKEMNGIYSSSINNNTLDEAPMAYKPMEEIIKCIGDTVEIKMIIKPIYNFKSSEK